MQQEVKNVDISKMSISELKEIGFDLREQIDYYSRSLEQVRMAIAKKSNEEINNKKMPINENLGEKTKV